MPATGPVRFLIPEKGVSALDAPGQPFHDREADAALFDALEDNLEADRIAPPDRACPSISTIPQFSTALAQNFREIAA